LYNNQVQFSCGNNGNFAGTIWQIFDSTHAWILPPWLNRGLGDFGWNSHMLASPTATTITLTKWDVLRVWQTAASVPQTFVLPLASACSPGDTLVFIYTGSSGSQVTISGNGSTINGSATYAMGTAQYSKVTLETDGSNWYILGT
jgi:hypothetical protein